MVTEIRKSFDAGSWDLTPPSELNLAPGSEDEINYKLAKIAEWKDQLSFAHVPTVSASNAMYCQR